MHHVYEYMCVCMLQTLKIKLIFRDDETRAQKHADTYVYTSTHV